jgi:quercetin dioxygenase-like cupin family protein
MKVRLVVSGQDAKNKSRVVSDELIGGVRIDNGIVTELWGSDEIPRFPNNGSRPHYENFFPPAAGHRFFLNSILPSTAGPPQVAESTTVGGGKTLSKGVAEILEKGEAAGMHTTDSVDLIVVLSGVAGLEFDDGEKILLHAGDAFVQNGTRHRWFNPGSEPATFAAFILGGHPRT